MVSSALKTAVSADATVARHVEAFLAHGVIEFGPVLDPRACVAAK
jgi:hypothetical protein